MNENSPMTAKYVAATRSELSDAGRGTRAAAALINQRALFPHRGRAVLFDDRLDLQDWNDQGAITVTRDSVVRITRQFDDLYGAFVGGASSKWGAPVIIERDDSTAIYLLFNHRAFLEKTDNPDWETALLRWLG